MIASTKTLVSTDLRYSRYVFSAVLILFAACLTHAQAVGSTRGLTTGEGNNSIQGRVYFPAGEGGKIVKINLESNQDVGGMSTATDQDGVFRFNSLRAGNYTVVVVGGKDYQDTREPVTIDPLGGGRVIQVNIQLRPKIDAANPAFTGVPHDALDFYQKGSAAAQKGNSKDAVEFLGKAVAASPNFALALSDLGSQYLKLLEWGKASQTFETLLKLKPNDATAHLDMGIALYNIGLGLLNDKKTDEFNQKMAEAGAHLREAIKLNSHGPSAHYYLGMTLVRLRQYEEAQTELELAVKNGGENIALAHRFLGGLYQRAHKNKEAATEFETYLKLDPKVKDADTIKGLIQNLRKEP